MPAVFDREGFIRILRTNLLIMFVTILVYSVLAITVLAPKVQPPAQLPLIEIGCALLAAALAGLGLWRWRRMADRKLTELPARKVGKAEREPGWPPRALAIRSRLFVITALLEAPALVGVMLRTLGAPLWESALYLVASAALATVVYLDVPAKVKELLG